MDLESVSRLLRRYFDDQERRFAVIGGYGLLAHGIQRATFDLDLAVESALQADLVEFLESQGYETLYRSSGYTNHLHREADLGRLDFVYLDAETARRVFEGCSTKEILGIPVLVPRPEHLAAMKARALKNDPGRKLQDLADIRQLAMLPGVDREEIQAYFDTLELKSLYDEMGIDE